MTNELTRVIDAIKQDPHGDVARNVCHWLAVEVMGAYEQGHWGIDYAEYVFNCGRRIRWPYWKPFTDANHTRMLVRKHGVYYESAAPRVRFKRGGMCLRPYEDDPTFDACAVLMSCSELGTLTDETLKGF